MPRYFERFPQIVYSNTVCIDITKRVVLDTKSRTVPIQFNPYTVVDGDRADSIARWYYGDAYQSWLVYHSMGAIDPYYSMPLDDRTFNEMIRAKYGSNEAAMKQIMHWRLEWADDTQEITTSGYTALTEPLKKYYNAVTGIGDAVLFWRRRREDWIVTTNMIVAFFVDAEGFDDGERVQLKTGNVVHSNSVVTFSNSSQVIVQHVQGNTSMEGTVLWGEDSNTTANVSGSSILANNIPINERPFWNPVFAYDYEVEQNHMRRQIRLIDAKYGNELYTKLRDTLRPPNVGNL
jgi:hypothetical protein